MSGNGVDLGAIQQTMLAISDSLNAFRTEITAEVRSQRRMLEEQGRTLAEQGRTLAEYGRALAEQGRKLDDLAEAVRLYHGSVVGHGILISEHDERISRLEHRAPPEAAE